MIDFLEPHSSDALFKRIKYILDTTVCINGDEKDATLSNVLSGNSVDFDVYARRIPIADLPKDDEGLSKWLVDLYVRKDEAKKRLWRATLNNVDKLNLIMLFFLN